ncbi:TPA: DUF551 domain-containing protein [Klebsiella pneumoniae]
MTKSTITRERAQQIFLGNGPEPSASEERELARMALAAMDGEPVAEVLSNRQGNDTSTIDRALPVVTKLYRHAQQPVVEREPIAWLNDAYLARGVVDGEAGSEDAGPGYIPVYREAGPRPAPVVPDELKEAAADFLTVLDECPEQLVPINRDSSVVRDLRAAMLAAAQQSPGSEPATVPGKWIPVSERMPEDSGRYWCYVEEQNDLGKSHYQWNCSWNGERWWVESENGGIVTHWMPLTASPQEAINALISVVSRNEQDGK